VDGHRIIFSGAGVVLGCCSLAFASVHSSISICNIHLKYKNTSVAKGSEISAASHKRGPKNCVCGAEKILGRTFGRFIKKRPELFCSLVLHNNTVMILAANYSIFSTILHCESLQKKTIILASMSVFV
jgi:hypothetical protein